MPTVEAKIINTSDSTASDASYSHFRGQQPNRWEKW